MSLIGALTKAAKAGETAKKTAPFYSAVDEALANIARPKGTGAEFFTELTKQPGVKKAELADRKLEQAFKAKGKMTKEEAQQVLKENPPPQIKERILDESLIKEEDELRDIVSEELYGMPYDRLDNNRARGRVFDEAFRRMGEENGPIYGDYKTPGGKNYREILLKLPSERPNASNYRDPAKYDADMKAYNASGKADYQSSHWKEDPNVLAHMRVQDRTGPNGEKILHVEEIQSDWHQEGRKKGYRNQEAIDKAKQAFEDYNKDAKERLRQIMLKESEGEMTPERAVAYVNNFVNGMDPSGIAGFLNEKPAFIDLYRATKGVGGSEIPDAPFKKNWHELAMKRLLNYAADKGYDSIAITPGAEQAKRYDLSKQVDELLYKRNPDGTYQLSAQARGTGNLIGEAIPAEKLEDYVGKDVAQKIIDNRGQERNLGGSGSVSQPKDVWGSLSGEGLQVGGEGMKGFYDKILPDYLNSFGKPYGSQVGTFSIPGDRGETVERLGVAGRNLSEMTPQEVIDFNKMVDEAGAKSLHHFKITPEMRESIKQKGLPLYQQIGIPTAGAGAASQMPEPEEGLAGGGVINSLAKTEALAKLAKLREQMAPRAEAVKELMAKDENKYLRDVTPNVLTNPEIEAEIARMKARAEASKPEVKLADGGAINFNTAPDMSDGGRIIEGAPFKRGGKVKVTANRDTMFMELSNKKLKRK